MCTQLFQVKHLCRLGFLLHSGDFPLWGKAKEWYYLLHYPLAFPLESCGHSPSSFGPR